MTKKEETILSLMERRAERKRKKIIRVAKTICSIVYVTTCVAFLLWFEIDDARTREEMAKKSEATFTTDYEIPHQAVPLAQTTEAPVIVEELEVNVEEVPTAEYIEDHENEKIEAALLAKANRMDDVMITHYCSELYPHICGTGDGLTASGREIQPYLSVAVDRSVIPLGSEVMIDYGDGEIHYYRADDVGAWVNGPHIDVAVTTHDEALQLGIKTATVWWIAPEEGGE